MGRLSSSIGLITGTEIVKTVDQLIAISAQSRDRLVKRTETLKGQQSAIAELTALVIGVQLAGGRLNQTSQFQARTATTSQSDAITTTTTPAARLGSFTVNTTQLAATHSAQSRLKATDTQAALGLSGEIVIRGGGGTLRSSVELSKLNTGTGVQSGQIRITDRSGKTMEVDLSAAKNVDDVIDAINQTAGIGVRATTVGDAIKLTDITGSTASNLRVDEVGNGETAADLGLRGINVGSETATGHAIYEDASGTGLRGVSLAKLGGGGGLGSLSSINITTRDGATGSIDLSSATNTQDILNLINDSGLAIEAKLNDSGSGFRIRDLSGGTATEFVISSADETAAKLGLNQTATDRVINGGDLVRGFVDNDTPLSSLRQGRGIAAGKFSITDSTGKTEEIDAADAANMTVGDLISKINASGLNVTAALNSTGDGFDITDNGGGSGTLRIRDLAGGKAAAELGLTGTAQSVSTGGGTAQRLSSAERQTVTVSAGDSLEAIVKRINDSSRLATASIVKGDDGSSTIAIRSARGGDAGRLSISSASQGLGFNTTAVGQDAIMSVTTEEGGTRQLRSVDGVFEEVVQGVSLTAKKLTDGPATITVNEDASTLNTNVKAFVSQYNKLVEKMKSLTFFDSEKQTSGLLFGSSEALRIESTYSRLLSGMVSGAGKIRSAGELGLSFNDQGLLQFNEARFAEKSQKDPEAVKAFLTSEKTGLVARLNDASDRIAGVKNSLLINRTESIGERIIRNEKQADTMKVRLDAERQRLLKQFIAAEEAIAKIQSNQNAISQIKFISASFQNR